MAGLSAPFTKEDEVACRVDVEAPGSVLQRCTRSLRLANFSLVSSIAKTSSTHSRS